MSLASTKNCKNCGNPLTAPGAACPVCAAHTPALPESVPDPEGRPELPPVRVGDLFEGKWRIESKLGAGGMGSVFLAHDLALDRKVAIKVLARELSADAQFVERFEREARLTAKLEHPNVVPVYAVGRQGGRPFMVMKKLDGDTLAYKLQAEGKIYPAAAQEYFRQLCAGLAHIHSHGCVHRDIKAGNIIISPSGLATILDFGVLRDPDSAGNTQAGMMLGTPRYMSPEQARGATGVDHRADLYALGVLLFECLVGRPPFEALTDLAIIHKHAQETPPDLIGLDGTLPRALGPMVQKALAKAPEDRFQTAGEFSAALDAALAGDAPLPVAISTSGVIPIPVPVPEPQAPAEPQPFPSPDLPPPDPSSFDPASFPDAAPEPLLAPEPAPVAQPAPAAVAAAPAVADPAAAKPKRRLFWPVVTVIALALAAAELYYLRFGGLEPAVPAERHAQPADDPPEPGRPTRPVQPTGPAKPIKTYGTLKVVSVLSDKPYVSTVEVDGVERGETPLTLELLSGKHRVTVSRQGFQTWRKDVQIAPRKVTDVKVDLLP
ncbi:MAG TPA: serine/threonine-protein kinase [Myxococcales bacterium]|jgi:serine/threonine-protein kinase